MALVLATVVAYGYAQHLKQAPPLVQGVRVVAVFTPAGVWKTAKVSFQLRQSKPVTVTVRSGSGGTVRVLAGGGQGVRPYRRLRYAWDGRDDRGAAVPDGRYRIGVQIGSRGRLIVLPQGIRVRRTQPGSVVADAKSVALRRDGSWHEVIEWSL